MNEIKCPNCGTVFQINETDYESIVKQIRDKEFEKEITSREMQYKIDKENAIKIAESNIEKKLTEELNKKIIEINELQSTLKIKEEQTKNKVENIYKDEINKKDLEINELKNKIKLQESKSSLDINNAISEKSKEIINLNNKLEISK